MKVMLCLASYAEVNGMYFDFEIDTEEFDKDEILKKANDYYNSIGEEEYLLADTWSDDDDTFNQLILKGYTESFYSFLDYLEVIIDGDLSIEQMKAVLVYNSYSGLNVKDIIEDGKYENIYLLNYNDLRDYISDKMNEVSEQSEIEFPSWFNSLIYWMDSHEAINFIENYELGTIIEYDNNYYEVYE